MHGWSFDTLFFVGFGCWKLSDFRSGTFWKDLEGASLSLFLIWEGLNSSASGFRLKRELRGNVGGYLFALMVLLRAMVDIGCSGSWIICGRGEAPYISSIVGSVLTVKYCSIWFYPLSCFCLNIRQFGLKSWYFHYCVGRFTRTSWTLVGESFRGSRTMCHILVLYVFDRVCNLFSRARCFASKISCLPCIS